MDAKNNKGNGKNNGKGRGWKKNGKDNFRSKDNRNSNNTRRRDDDAASARTDERAGRNDASWYKITDQIARDAGQLSFNNALGMPLSTITDVEKFVFPGVCALWYAPTVGEADDPTSPINLQATKLMSFLRSKVSNRLDFAAADVMMYLVAMDSMYSFYSYCVRLYGMHFSYISMNRYYPQHLFNALGVNADSTSDWNKFRTWLNTWAYQLSQVFVPASLTYFARHMWMNANIYLDAPDPKAQTYIFTPEYLYQWDSEASTFGTCLLPVAMPTTDAQGATLEQLINFGNSLIINLISNKDVAEMSGLVLRAFGENNCVKLSTIPEEFAVAPVYNAEVLTQIHNATICGKVVLGTTPDSLESAIITQTPDDSLYTHYIVNSGSVGSVKHLEKSRLIDLQIAAPSVDDVFVATRLMATGVPEAGNQNAQLTYFGTEVLTRAMIWKLTAAQEVPSAALLSNTAVFPNIVALSSAFNSFPYLYPVDILAESTQFISGIIGDITNYTAISGADLGKLHSAATIALLDIPTVGA